MTNADISVGTLLLLGPGGAVGTEMMNNNNNNNANDNAGYKRGDPDGTTTTGVTDEGSTSSSAQRSSSPEKRRRLNHGSGSFASAASGGSRGSEFGGGNVPARQLAMNGLLGRQDQGLVGMGGGGNSNFFFGGQDSHLQSLFALQNHQAALANQQSGGGGGFQGGFSGFGAGSAQATLQQQLAWRQAFPTTNSLLQQGLSGGISQGLLSGQSGLLSPAITQAQNRAVSGAGVGGGLSGLQSLRDSNIMVPSGSDLQHQQHQSGNSAGVAPNSKLSGRAPSVLYMSCDDDSLSEYQCLVRKQIELFEAGREEVESNAKGRNKPIVLGQVGIRCGHCSMLNPRHRARGATYYPAKLNGLYQAAQSMASGHLCFHCQHIPDEIRQELLVLRERKSSAGGGKKYWGDGVRVLGVFENEDGLCFEKR